MNYHQWHNLFTGISSVKYLVTLHVDVEKWKNYTNHLCLNEQHSLFTDFLTNLYNNHNESLTKLNVNIDEWEYLNVYQIEYAHSIMKFRYLVEIQVLWMKSSQLSHLHYLHRLQNIS